MCDPTTAMLAISAVSAGTSYIGGQQNASAQAKASNNATSLSYQQNAERQKQINEQSALDTSERTKQGLLERGKIAAIAGESGALGLSSDRLVADSFMQEGTDISSLERNRLNSETQTMWSNTQSQAQGNSANVKAYNSAPTLLSTGLQIGGEYVKYKTTSTGNAKKASV